MNWRFIRCVGLSIMICHLLVRSETARGQGTNSAAPNIAARDSIIHGIELGRRQTEEWLKTSPSSYLAAIRRVDFGNRLSLTIGRTRENDVQIDDPDISARNLRVTVVGDSFAVQTLDAGAGFMVESTRTRDAILPPSSITLGRYTIRLSHQRFPALIVFDPSSPRFREFKGLRFFPVDLRYRYVLTMEVDQRKDTTVILSSRGNRRKALRVGWFNVEVDQTMCRLEVSRLLEPGVGERSYSIFFRDGTCGTESYGMGRYVEAEEVGEGLFLLDFNSAYNPACAFSDHFNCPVPPAQNQLPVRIPAGEMDSHYGAH